MDSMTQFWGTAIGAALVAALMAGIVALRQGKLALMGVSLRDFPGVTGVACPLEHPSVGGGGDQRMQRCRTET